MVFTAQQISRIRRCLGYPDRAIGCSPLDAALQSTTVDGAAAVVCLLDRIDAIEGRLTAALCRVGVDRVDNIELDTQDLLCGLRSEGSRLAGQVASILGVRATQSPFGAHRTGIAAHG